MLLELMETSQDGEESGEYGLSPVIEINFKRDFPKSCPGKGQPQVAENCTYRVRKCYFTAQCTLSGDKGNRGDGEANGAGDDNTGRLKRSLERGDIVVNL